VKWLYNVVYLLTHPEYFVRAVLRRWPWTPCEMKLAWDATDRPNYTFGVYHAALEARALGIKRISVIEFGVAGGNGLVALEKTAADVSKSFGMRIDVFGFDTGQGMPPPVDYRDVPYLWREGDYAMDQAKLLPRLKTAKLVLGDIRKTIPSFIAEYKPAPIGFVSFDLDYYSSTVQAFKLWDGDSQYFLPRVLCYFDDIVADEWTHISPHAGELLAISEFNSSNPSKKIDPIMWLSFNRRIPALWNQKMFVFHNFVHPLYSGIAHSEKSLQIPLAI
jgi:hypothetical protein